MWWKVLRISTAITCSCSREPALHQAQGALHSPKYKLQLHPLREASTLGLRHVALSSLSSNLYPLPQRPPPVQKQSCSLSPPSPAHSCIELSSNSIMKQQQHLGIGTRWELAACRARQFVESLHLSPLLRLLGFYVVWISSFHQQTHTNKYSDNWRD